MTVAELTADQLPTRPLYRVEYEALARQGFFADEKVELLEGQLVANDDEGEPHAQTQRRLLRAAFEAISGQEGEIGAGNPIALSDTSEPEPDVAVYLPGTCRGHHPRTATLLIEVSHTSLRRDRTLKARLYAEAGVPEYWLVDLVHDQVIVHREPVDGAYRAVEAIREGRVRALRHPALVVDVETLFR